jgi:hypothetical protein
MMQVDMNDPEVIESLKFLLVSKEEKIQTSTRPFDSKKDVFFPEHKEGYVAVKIQSVDEKAGTTTGKDAKGNVIIFIIINLNLNYLIKKQQQQQF